MTSLETIKIEVGYEEDGGTITFVDIDKDSIPLVRKTLAYLHKQEQEEKARARATASTCCNCKHSLPRSIQGSLCCSKQIVNKYYKKVVRPTQTCEMFDRKEE